MTSSYWETHTIPKAIFPNHFNGHVKHGYWGKETTLTVVPKKVGINLFKKVLSHISLDKTIMDSPEVNDVTTSNLLTHYIEYNINDNYEITRHHDNCTLTIIIYISKDTDVEDEFYLKNERCNEHIWNWNENNSYTVLAFNGYIEHWGKLTGKGERKVLVFHYDKNDFIY